MNFVLRLRGSSRANLDPLSCVAHSMSHDSVAVDIFVDPWGTILEMVNLDHQTKQDKEGDRSRRKKKRKKRKRKRGERNHKEKRTHTRSARI